jgi:hypothetical protein
VEAHYGLAGDREDDRYNEYDNPDQQESVLRANQE